MKSGLLRAFLLIVLFVGVVTVCVFSYQNYCTPDIFVEFEKYNGFDFNYLDEESNYINKLHYSQLTEDEAQYYRAMYHAASTGETEYRITITMNSDDEFRARLAFGADFPEYFWFGDDVEYIDTPIKDKLNIFSWNYLTVHQDCYQLNDEDIPVIVEKINNKLDEVLPTLEDNTDYDTLLNVYKYVIDNTEYDMAYQDISDIRASFLEGRGVCSSYAETFQLLCNKLGYECYTVLGYSKYIEYDSFDEPLETNNEFYASFENDLHEWNIIKLEDAWYWVDPTWGDNPFKAENFNYNDPYNMNYFLSYDEVLSIDHTCNDDFQYPACNDYSYYLCDGLGAIIHTYNQEEINNVLVSLFNRHKNNYVFQFFNEEDTKRLYDWLNNGSDFFDLYQYRVYPYYNGYSSYAVDNNYAIHLCWNITNLY